MFKQIYELFNADSLYEQALIECHEMLDIDATMFNESVNSLRKSDTAEIPIDIYSMDQKINAFEYHFNLTFIKTLSYLKKFHSYI